MYLKKIHRSIWESILRILASVFVGGLFYFLWLVCFLLLAFQGNVLKGILWVVSPIVTGFGFALGILIFNRVLHIAGDKFLQVIIWPVIGCIVGALIIFWFGPMLIVFSMLLFGTLSISIKELVYRQE